MKNKIVIFIIVFFSALSFAQPVTNVKHPAWSYDKTIYEVNIRQYTPEGTFKAFKKHLPELKELGVGILWIMPINPIGEVNRKGALGSYYAVKDYLKVNPKFGTLEDFKALVNEAHKLGLYVIIDWVANHTSWDNVLVKEHPDFYTKDKNGKFVAPIADWTDVIDLNYDNKDLWNYMTGALEYWVKECNIDGYRCDVAGMVPTEFWDQARTKLETIKPVFMLAESEDPLLQVNAFDMTYSWDIYKIARDIPSGKKDVNSIRHYFNGNETKFPKNDFRMRFTSNHDENTWQGTEFEQLGDAVEVFTVFNYTIPGMPLIYSGQEAGNKKRLKFFEKDPIKWQESKFRSLYTALNKLKSENSALWNGDKGADLKELETNDKDNIYAFTRENAENNVTVILNLSNYDKKVTIKDAKKLSGLKDYFTGKTVTFENNSVTLKRWQYLVLVK